MYDNCKTQCILCVRVSRIYAKLPCETRYCDLKEFIRKLNTETCLNMFIYLFIYLLNTFNVTERDINCKLTTENTLKYSTIWFNLNFAFQKLV